MLTQGTQVNWRNDSVVDEAAGVAASAISDLKEELTYASALDIEIQLEILDNLECSLLKLVETADLGYWVLGSSKTRSKIRSVVKEIFAAERKSIRNSKIVPDHSDSREASE